jgi:hypothetical protein
MINERETEDTAHSEIAHPEAAHSEIAHPETAHSEISQSETAHSEHEETSQADTGSLKTVAYIGLFGALSFMLFVLALGLGSSVGMVLWSQVPEIRLVAARFLSQGKGNSVLL